MFEKSSRLASLKKTVTLVAELVGGKELTAQAAAKKINVEIAAARRQLKALEGLPGVSVDTRGSAHIWRYTQPASSLGYDKVIAACFGSSLAPAFAGTTYHQGFRSVRQWLIERSPHRQHFGNIDRKFLVLLQGRDVDVRLEDSPLDDLLEAMLKERRVCITYENFEGSAEVVRAEPLSLLLHHHRLYLVVRLKGGRLRPLRFARISEVQVLEKFAYPAETEYAPEAVFQDSYGVFLTREDLGLVKFQLIPKWRAFVRTHLWHATQKSVENEAGVLVTMNVSRCPELVSFLLGFGPDCEVLEPRKLREEIATAAAKLAAVYRCGPAVEPGR
jgi:predicted DNA-binding transcriptional regulator YafY